jgi:hypothetical protein
MNETLKVKTLSAKKQVKKKNKFDDALLKLGYSFAEKADKTKKIVIKEEQ